VIRPENLPRATRPSEAERRAQKGAVETASFGLFGARARRMVGNLFDPKHVPAPGYRPGDGNPSTLDLYAVRRSASDVAQREHDAIRGQLHADVRASFEPDVDVFLQQVADQYHRAFLRNGGNWFALVDRDVADALGSTPEKVREAAARLVLLGAITQRRSFGSLTLETRSSLPFTRAANPTKY
jgi:hypothetical protein